MLCATLTQPFCTRSERSGRPIPEVEYSAEETATWGEALNELIQLYPTAACREFLASFPAFGFTPDRVPQLQDLTEVPAPIQYRGAS